MRCSFHDFTQIHNFCITKNACSVFFPTSLWPPLKSVAFFFRACPIFLLPIPVFSVLSSLSEEVTQLVNRLVSSYLAGGSNNNFSLSKAGKATAGFSFTLYTLKIFVAEKREIVPLCGNNLPWEVLNKKKRMGENAKRSPIKKGRNEFQWQNKKKYGSES